MKHLILLEIQNMMDINVRLLQWFIYIYIFFDKKISDGAATLGINPQLKIKIFLIKNSQKNYTNKLSENLRKGKYTQLFTGNIWSADLADMQLISKFNKGFTFLLCFIDIYSKYARLFL